MLEGGPVGNGIAAVMKGNPTSFQTNSPHDLADRAVVRISTASGPVECYAKVEQSDKFSTFKDVAMTTPLEVNGVVPGDTVEQLNAEDWAVIAGINYYPAFTNLKGAVTDATEFERWTLRYGYVPREHVKLIQSPSQAPGTVYDAQPNIVQVSNEFLRLADEAQSKKLHRLGRRLYIFLSGHGIVATLASTPDYREAALLMANASPNALTQHIGARAHAEWFRALGIFDEVILFADCCRDLEDNVPPAILGLPKWSPLRPAARHFYAFPTMLASKSWEREFGNPATMRGIFSYVVVEALKNPKLYTKEGTLPGSTLEKHIYATVPGLNGKQSPIVDYPHDFEGDPTKSEVIFAKWFQRSRQRVQIEFDPPCPGCTAILFRGVTVGRPLATSSTDVTWLDDLDAGFIYKVEIQGTNRFSLFQVTGNDEVQIVRV
jgi:hypothetical protein